MIPKQIRVLIAMVNAFLMAFGVCAAEPDATISRLQGQLDTCRMQAPKSWSISGFGPAQVDLAMQINPNHLSFFENPLPANLTRTIPNQAGRIGDDLTVSKGLALFELVRQIKNSQCPVEVLGFASQEGLERQNIRFAQVRRDKVIDDLVSFGVPDYGIYTGAAEVSASFAQLSANRRVVIRTRPDLAWRCELILNAGDLFPIQGQLVPGMRSYMLGEDLQALSEIWATLSGILEGYPCQFLATTFVAEGRGDSKLVQQVRTQVPELANRILVKQNVDGFSSILLGINLDAESLTNGQNLTR